MDIPFKIEFFPPSKSLEPYVRRWIFFEYISDHEYIHQVAPSGTIYINHGYDCDQPIVLKDDEILSQHEPTLFIGHPVSHDVRVKYHPGVKQILVEFTYTGFYQLFKFPIHKLNNVECSTALFGFGDLSELLKGHDNPHVLKDILEKYLIDLARTALPSDPRVSSIISEIEQHKFVEVRDKLKSLKASEQKRMYRLFRKYNGLSPKQFLRIYQLNLIIHLMNTEDYDSLTNLALKSGYYDQSNFIKHIKEQLSFKPSTLINQKEEVLFKFMGGL